MNINELIESSKGIEPYRPSQTVAAIAVGLGLTSKEVLKLNANENLFLDPLAMKEVLVEAAYETDPRLYPQGEEENIKQRIGEVNAVKPSQVIVSAGGDQVIELLFSLPQRGEAVTAVSPSFSMYPRAALQRGLAYREASLEPDFSLDVDKALETAEGSSLLVVCNPNNPTGNQFPREDIIELVNGFKGLVLLDEAYQEYSKYSLAETAEEYENLVVLRTFSKAYGLAGLRLGYCITNEKIAATLRERYLMPYPVSNIVLKAGLKILGQQDMIREAVEKTKTERAWLIDELNKLDGVRAYPSETNFVLFTTRRPYNEIYDALLSHGIIVRKIGAVLGNDNCLRVTVAPRPLLQRFLDALKEANQ